jgi:hypothetical protein
VQFFSEIFRKKSFSEVKNKSYLLSEEKNNMPVNCTIHKCKSNEYYSSNKENKPKFNFTGKCLFLQQCINQALMQ